MTNTITTSNLGAYAPVFSSFERAVGFAENTARDVGRLHVVAMVVESGSLRGYVVVPNGTIAKLRRRFSAASFTLV